MSGWIAVFGTVVIAVSVFSMYIIRINCNLGSLRRSAMVNQRQSSKDGKVGGLKSDGPWL